MKINIKAVNKHCKIIHINGMYFKINWDENIIICCNRVFNFTPLNAVRIFSRLNWWQYTKNLVSCNSAVYCRVNSINMIYLIIDLQLKMAYDKCLINRENRPPHLDLKHKFISNAILIKLCKMYILHLFIIFSMPIVDLLASSVQHEILK